jgi:cytochrome P450
LKPFGHGPRDCIGKNLAYAELRLIVSRLLFRFDYEMAAGQENWLSQQRLYNGWDKGPLMGRFTLRRKV